MICPSCSRNVGLLVEGSDLCIGCDALLPDWPSTDTRAGLRRLRIWIDEELGRRTAEAAAPPPPRQRRSRYEIPPCGTETAYQRHRHYKEPIDDPCRLAHNENERVKDRERRARARGAA